MQNDKEKFKNEFKRRLYSFVLRVVKLIDKLSKGSIVGSMLHMEPRCKAPVVQ